MKLSPARCLPAILIIGLNTFAMGVRVSRRHAQAQARPLGNQHAHGRRTEHGANAAVHRPEHGQPDATACQGA